MTVFILQNQHGQFLSKGAEWVDGCDANTLFSSPHQDVALNHLIEVNAKDHSLRAAVIVCELNSKGKPVPPDTPYNEADTIATETADESTAQASETPEHHNITSTDETATVDKEADVPQITVTQA